MKNLSPLRMAACVALVVSLSVGFAASAYAYAEGINGVSGKSNGFYCRNCHAGGTAPTVAFGGPTAMILGSTATFSFTVTSNSASQIAAGLDVAASAGTLGLVAGQGTRLLLDEVTHSSPMANDSDGKATFEFIWQAPESAGTYTLFGAGCSVNGNSQRTGDAAARTTYQIVVGADVPTPTPPPPPTATATATARENACVGDCGSDGEVTVDELITGVNVALGVTPLSACPVFDANGDGEVTIDELLQAVNSALNACPVG
ncbi:MAG: hypothetical protein HY270_03345 [Deltaproteobacteria bacterium]|nr:hypothetical protein [Deltaproteobacteria bacterium]